MKRYRFNISHGDERREFEIPPGKTVIGRVQAVDLRLDEPLISRRHAEVQLSGETLTITDLGSSNGTSLNGEKITPELPYPFDSGDKIEIGSFELTLMVEEVAEPVAEPAPPPPKPTPPKKTPSKAKDIPPPSLPPSPETLIVPDYSTPPPGLSKTSSRYLDYLPPIYHTDFMGRYLAILEAVLGPIEWNVDNFDLYLDPRTAPEGFLPWLQSWFDVAFDDTWSQAQKRTFLQEAHEIFARRGTKWSLSRVLEIYTGHAPEIDDQREDLDPFTFEVKLPVRKREVDPALLERLIDAHKPAHTSYKLMLK